MTEHLSNQESEQYRRGLSAPAELLALDDHLAACAACRARAALVAEPRLAAFKADYHAAATEAAHLDYEELAAYVDGGLDDVGKEIVRSHLAICSECMQEDRDLRAFKSAIAPSLHKVYEPAVADEIAKDERSNAGATPTPVEAVDQTAEAVIALNDGGGQVALHRDGRLIGLEGLSSSAQTAVKTALQRQKAVDAAALAGLRGDDGALMSGQPKHGEFDVLKPRGEVVASERPAFVWRALAGATTYTVKIFDEHFNLVAQSQPLTNTTWRPTEPLARGAVYSWQVTAVKDGQEVKAPRPPAPQAKFKVLDARAAAELRAVRQQQPTSHLTLGVLYARAGLLDEAERELRALLQANP